MMQSPLGIVAGLGELPLVALRAAQREGRTVVVITYDDESEALLKPEADILFRVGVAQIGKTISAFKKAGVTQILFVGKIDKRVLYKNPKFDLTALALLRRLKNRNDDSIMLGLIEELAKKGLTVIDQADYLKELMPGVGVLSKRVPSDTESTDIIFGMEMARGIAALDIGQTVVVHQGAVVAVEAIDGTDDTIRRGGTIAPSGATICKVAKPAQDSRFDIPTLGVTTIESMVAVGAKVLAFEAGATLVVALEAVIKAANAHDLTLIGVAAK